MTVCKSLTSITIPEGVTTIGISAFQGCKSLISITLPSSVTTIDACAFYGCKNLTSITIPSSVTHIDEDAFTDCPLVTDVYYAGTEEQWRAIDIDSNLLPERATIHYNS